MSRTETEILSRMWLRRLHGEFTTICARYHVSLKPPVIEISDSKRQLGSWTPETRTIQISRTLILEHPWDRTVNVLKHEMAHMICSEIFNESCSGHDESFRRGCDWLGLHAPFRKATADLQADPDQPHDQDPLQEESRRVLAKIRKLLALAGSENEHEAALAMQKACDLMTTHNIRQLEQDHHSGYDYLIIATGKKQMAAYRRTLCGILMEFFHVRVILSSMYDPLKNDHFKTIELMGRPENISIAEHCYHFMEDRLQTLWQQNRRKWSGSTITLRNSYYLGILQGFRQKLKMQAERHRETLRNRSSNQTPALLNSLLVQEDKRLQDFVSARHPSLRTSRSAGPRVYRDTYDEAVETGRSINLHRPIHKTGDNSSPLAIE